VQNLITEHLDTWTQAIETKSSAGRGSSNKFTLVGIKKLRELILEMAVCGLLVPQNPNDEPASVLLEKIASEKALLLKDGKIKKTKVLPEISEDEKPFELPTGWGITHLDNISVINGGFAFKSSQYVDVGIRVIRISDFDEKGFKDNNIVRYTYSPELEQYNIAQNNILMAMTGGTVGKSLLVMDLPEQMLTNQRVACIKIFTGFIERYVHSVLMTSLAQDVIEDAKNSTNDNISMTNIKSFIIPVPPLEEQKRIVAKVDELMALCDQLEQQTLNSIEAHQTLVETLLNELVNSNNTANIQQAWSLIAENFDVLFTTEKSIDTLKQTILQLAVMGKLVPQNPSDEPASKLLEKIAAEKAQLIKDKKIKKSKALPEITEEEKPFDLPSGWERVRLADALDVRDGTHDSPKDALSGITYPLVTSKNFSNGEIDFEGARRISEKNHQLIIQRSKVDKFDILFSMIGGNIGNQVMVKCDTEFSIKNVALFKYFDKALTNPFFIKIYLEDLANYLQSEALGGAQPFVSLGKLRSLVLALPPKEEQERIVNKANELMTLCDQLKTQLQTAQQTQTNLAQSIAQKALA